MPIEIRELVIKVTVGEEKKDTGGEDIRELKDKIIKECIEKMMTKLETLPER